MLIFEKNSGTTVWINGESYLYFGGTNYLGLLQDEKMFD